MIGGVNAPARPAAEGEPLPMNPLLDLSAHPVIAHRGASAYAPENTLPAFDMAARQGADAFELDVRLTKDGAAVVIHDATLERTTGMTGPVRARNLAELRSADAGRWFTPDRGRTLPFRGTGVRIPALAEVLWSFPQMPVMKSLPGIIAMIISPATRKRSTPFQNPCAGWQLRQWSQFRPIRFLISKTKEIFTAGMIS